MRTTKSISTTRLVVRAIWRTLLAIVILFSMPYASLADKPDKAESGKAHPALQRQLGLVHLG